MFEVFHTRGAKGLSTAFGILTGVGTLLSWLTPAWFGELTLPEAIIVGIGFALGASLIIAMCLALGGWGFRLIRPRPDAIKDDMTVSAISEAYDDTDLRETTERHGEALTGIADLYQRLEARIAAVEQLNKAIIDDYQRMLGLEAQNADKLACLRSDIGITRAELQKAEDIRLKVQAQVQASFNAIRAREHLERVVDPIIRADAVELNRRHDAGEPFDNDAWDKWQNVHSHWFNALCGWWQTARFYMAHSREVLIAPDSAYAGEPVNEELFPNAEATRVFRKFRIIQRQWEGAQEALIDNLRLVAFSGMSELEVRNGQLPEQGDRPL